MSTFTNLSSEQLRHAADLKEKISALELELASLLEGTNGVAAVPAPADGKLKTRKISAAGIARIKAAQKIRWAKYNEESVVAEPVRVKKFTMSPAAKAKISAAAKARWAKVRAGKPAPADAPKKKFTMSAAAKAKISAAAKIRWAKVRAAKKA